MSNNHILKSDSAKHLYTLKKQSVDLFLCYCGKEDCLPNHSFGPSIRSQYLIHYVLKGKGTYTIDNKTYTIKENQGFLIPANEITFYQSDETDPWSYVWIGFNGIKAETYLNYANITKSNPVFEYTRDGKLKEYIYQMLELDKMTYSNHLKIEGLLYLFISELVQASSNTNNYENFKSTDLYLEKSIEFIENNYINNIKVSDIAYYIGLNRSYLSNIFKKNLNTSPQEYIINYRIEKACELLKCEELSIGNVARSVGYCDPLTFSKTFKKIKKMSPKKYRDTILS